MDSSLRAFCSNTLSSLFCSLGLFGYLQVLFPHHQNPKIGFIDGCCLLLMGFIYFCVDGCHYLLMFWFIKKVFICCWWLPLSLSLSLSVVKKNWSNCKCGCVLVLTMITHSSGCCLSFTVMIAVVDYAWSSLMMVTHHWCLMSIFNRYWCHWLLSLACWLPLVLLAVAVFGNYWCWW